MKKTGQVVRRYFLPTAALLVWSGVAYGQDSKTAGGPHRELSGIIGASALLAINGSAAADGMWAMKAAAFGRGRVGVEGSFEQSTRLPQLRYLGGDLVYQFRTDPKRMIPFVHAGAGSYFVGSAGNPAFSFGVGIKQLLTNRIGLRIGVQDRVSMRQPEYHRLDVYGGIFFRF